jgi:hypothetical protein
MTFLLTFNYERNTTSPLRMRKKQKAFFSELQRVQGGNAAEEKRIRR